MNKQVQDMLDRLKRRTKEEAEKEHWVQRLSFAYGNLTIDDDSVDKRDVEIAALRIRLAELEEFAKDIRDNYDHEGRDDCYPSCRRCRAIEVIGGE